MRKTSPSLSDSHPGLSGSFFIDTSYSERAGCHPVTQDNIWLGIWNSWEMGNDYAGLEHYGLEDDIVTYEQGLYIPDNNSLKLKVTYQYHDAKVAGHFG